MIKAIETRYAGCRFRSRLEARWAVFMDHLGVPWEYEPQGYVVNGMPYLPDFHVHPNTGRAFWLEIKGVFPSDDELAKARGLAEGTGITTYVYWAQPAVPGPDLSHLNMNQLCGWDRSNYIWTNDQGWRENPAGPPAWQIGLTPTAFRFNPSGKPAENKSGFWWWTECPHCGNVVIKMSGQVGSCPLFDEQPNLPEELGELYPRFAHRTPRLQAAYTAARSARFEHGELGTPRPGAWPVAHPTVPAPRPGAWPTTRSHRKGPVA